MIPSKAQPRVLAMLQNRAVFWTAAAVVAVVAIALFSS
jgi:hypothetical protein